MLKSGADYLDGLRDGRVVYVGGEKVADVTAHPAFRNAAHTVAGLYDLKRDPAHCDSLSYEEDGERHSMYYLLPRDRDDLLKRSRAHKLISDQTYGLFGRSPDHVASFVAGLALQPEIFQPDYRDNLLGYYRRSRTADSYIAYAVLPPQGGRDPEFSQRQPGYVSPSLRVVGEDNSGVTIEGIKTLATGGVLADEIWLGNLQPLGPGQEALSITCAVPVAAEGMSLWARKPLELGANSEFDSPLAHRFDETDAVVVCRGVKVPWENVFVHNHVALSREIYIRTPSHCFGNHQSNVRFWSKLRLMLAVARRIADVNGTIKIPAVQETLGRLAAYEATIAAMVHGQCMAHEDLGNGYVSFNRRYMYGALSWCTENYPMLCDTLRELMGGGVFMMPADISVLDQTTRGTFESHWSTPGQPALDRMKLFKLAWDLVGSEFGGRHMQYEKFYAGPSFVVRNHSFRECPWGEMAGVLDRLLASYDVPGEYRTA